MLIDIVRVEFFGGRRDFATPSGVQNFLFSGLTPGSAYGTVCGAND